MTTLITATYLHYFIPALCNYTNIISYTHCIITSIVYNTAVYILSCLIIFISTLCSYLLLRPMQCSISIPIYQYLYIGGV